MSAALHLLDAQFHGANARQHRRMAKQCTANGNYVVAQTHAMFGELFDLCEQQALRLAHQNQVVR